MHTYDSIHELKQFKYDVAQIIKEHAVEYSFISEGEWNLLKVVSYSFVEELNGKKHFNFGFGDYNFADGAITDDVISNNGDAYRVFNTVLSTIPRFFEIHNTAIMSVKGSDSSPEFAEACRTTCKKNCADICRNANRRINIYRGYVNKHYGALKKDYTIYGGVDRTGYEPAMIDYTPDHKQKSILLMRNKNQHSMQVQENQTHVLRESTSAEEMMALYLKQREEANWSDLFPKQTAAAREYFKGLVLPDHLREDL